MLSRTKSLILVSFFILVSTNARAGLYDEVTTGPCAEDFRRHCGSVEPGSGRILLCLEENSTNLSFSCRNWGGFGRSLLFGGASNEPVVEEGKKKVGRFIVEDKPVRPSCTRRYMLMHGSTDCID